MESLIGIPSLKPRARTPMMVSSPSETTIISPTSSLTPIHPRSSSPETSDNVEVSLIVGLPSLQPRRRTAASSQPETVVMSSTSGISPIIGGLPSLQPRRKGATTSISSQDSFIDPIPSVKLTGDHPSSQGFSEILPSSASLIGGSPTLTPTGARPSSQEFSLSSAPSSLIGANPSLKPAGIRPFSSSSPASAPSSLIGSRPSLQPTSRYGATPSSAPSSLIGAGPSLSPTSRPKPGFQPLPNKPLPSTPQATPMSSSVTPSSSIISNGDILAKFKQCAVDDLKLKQADIAFASGAQGSIWKGVYHDRPVAIKYLKQISEDNVASFVEEVLAWLPLRHPNIVRLLAADLTPTPRIVMQLCEGSLLHRLKDGTPFPWGERLKFATHIASGLDYLHDRGLLHRDLKADNVLLSKGTAMLCDFGMSQLSAHETEDILGFRCGTPQWMAPELWQLSSPEKATDIYALGVLFFELASRQLPWPCSSIADITAALTEGGRPMVRVNNQVFVNQAPFFPETGQPKYWWELVELCWQTQPSARPSTTEVSKHLKQLTERPTVPLEIDAVVSSSWSVRRWLASIDLESLAPIFENNGFDDLLMMQNISAEDLDFLKISSLPQRKKILLSASQLGGPKDRLVSVSSASSTSESSEPAITQLNWIRWSSKLKLENRIISYTGPPYNKGYDDYAQIASPSVIGGLSTYSVVARGTVLIGWAPASINLETKSYKNKGYYLKLDGFLFVGQSPPIMNSHPSKTAVLGLENIPVSTRYDRHNQCITFSLSGHPYSIGFRGVTGDLVPTISIYQRAAGVINSVTLLD